MRRCLAKCSSRGCASRNVLTELIGSPFISELSWQAKYLPLRRYHWSARERETRRFRKELLIFLLVYNLDETFSPTSVKAGKYVSERKRPICCTTLQKEGLSTLWHLGDCFHAAGSLRIQTKYTVRTRTFTICMPSSSSSGLLHSLKQTFSACFQSTPRCSRWRSASVSHNCRKTSIYSYLSPWQRTMFNNTQLSSVIIIYLGLGTWEERKSKLTLFRNSGGIPPCNLATIFIASSHCIKPLSPGCGVKLNLIFVSSTEMRTEICENTLCQCIYHFIHI